MNRKIKFRVYNKLHNKWEHGPGQEVNLFGESILMGAFMRVRIAELNDCEALQFTGLFDKNGKEIYEGDYLSWYDRGSLEEPPESGLYQVFWSEENGKWSASDFDSNEEDLYNLKFDYVAGNIFENPELFNSPELLENEQQINTEKVNQ